jgi:hypothetical protein
VSTDAAADIADRVLARAKKRRRPPTYREFAKTIALPAGEMKGHAYDPNSDACQSYLIDQMDSGKWERFYVCAPPQYGGKTLVGVLLPALRNAIALRLPVGYGLPTLQDLDKAWAEKLKPALLKSGYEDHLPKAGPGARGGRGHTLQFLEPVTLELEGMLVFLAGGAYGSTVAAAIVDEVDQFRLADGTPLWGALEDIFNRANAYGRKALRIAVGTIEHDEHSMIVPLIMEHGTGTRPWPKCPHCSRHQLFTWEAVRYDPTDETTVRESARIACEHCGCLLTESDRRRAVAAAKFAHRGQTIDEAAQVAGAAPRTSSLGLLWTALDSSLTDLREVCVDHLRAKLQLDSHGDHGLMRKFYRYKLCQCYTAEFEEMGNAAELTWRYLLDRATRCKTFGPSRPVTDRSEDNQPTYSRHLAEPPPDCIGAVAGVDVQENRTYWCLVGYAADGTTYDFAWGYEYARQDRAPANPGELGRLLDGMDIMFRQSCGTLPLIAAGIDVGDQTDTLLAWCKGKPTWKPTKGISANMKDEPGDIPGIVHKRDGLFFVAVDAVRELIHSAYRRQNGQPGAAHIPSGLQNTATDTAYLRHICAEKQIMDAKTKKFRIIRGPGRWDWQDARRIAEVMVRLQLRPKRTGPTRKYGAVGTVKAF